MERRRFLRNSALAGLGMPWLKARAVDPDGLSPILPPTPDIPFALAEMTIDALQQKMQNGSLSSVSITRQYLQRIHAIDKSGPCLNAVIENNPDALRIADALDKERRQGRVRGPLHGIPILVKDNINTGDKMMTTAGALALKGHRAASDAFIIERLREAGAVLLGKTNLSEWANFRSSRSTSAWSSRGGQTKCAYMLDRNPSGSSSGSGSATAANCCALSIGTETDGSIVSPSSVNGLVGIKPTVGLWSRSGIIPISATQDTAGPMARSVKDAAILLGALAGPDPRDPVTASSAGHLEKDYTAFLDKNGLKGRRIGIEKSHLKGHEGIVALLQKAMRTMESLGATLVEVDLLKALGEIGNAEFKVLLYEFKDGVNRYLAGIPSSASSAQLPGILPTPGSANAASINPFPASFPLPRSLQEVIDFNERHAVEAMPFFRQETLVEAQSKGDLNSQEYTDALAKTLSSRAIITALMEEYQLDALSGCTNGLACCIDLANGDYDTGFSLSTPAAMAGFPHITVPMGQVDGLPLGLSFFGKAYAEGALLAFAYAYEQATMHRTPPLFRKDLLSR